MLAFVFFASYSIRQMTLMTARVPMRNSFTPQVTPNLMKTTCLVLNGLKTLTQKSKVDRNLVI